MSSKNLSSEWLVKKLGDFIKLEYGKPLDRANRNSDAKYPVYGANGVKSWSDEFLCDKPSIIVGRKGSAGEVTLTEGKFWPLDVTYFVTFDETKLNLIFIYHLLKLLNLAKLAKGVKPGINRNDIYSIKVLVPPLAEQKRIVEILDKAFECIDAAKTNIEQNLKNSREVFENYLGQAFINQKAKFKIKKLKDVCDVIGGGTPSKSNADFYKGSIPWATVRDMKNEVINITEFKITEEAVKQSATNIIPKENIIIATRVGLGKVCFLAQDTAINQDLKGIIPKEKVVVRYLFWWFKSIGSIIINHGTGATVQGVKLPFIWNLDIPIPPISNQKSVAAKIDALSIKLKKIENIYSHKLALLEELKKSLLQKAFSGELTKDFKLESL